MRAHHHRQSGAQFLHQRQDAQRGCGIRIGDDQCACAQQPGGDQYLAPCRIAKHHALACRCGLADALWIDIQCDHRQFFLFQKARQILPAAAIAADHHVFVGRHRLHRDVVYLHRAHHPFVGGKAPHDGVAALDDERRRQHRQHHRRQHRLQQLRAEQLGVVGVREHNETKFAARTERQTRAQGHAGARTHHARNAENEKRFHHHQRHQNHADPGILRHHAKVQQHADGDKKQSQQHIPKRFDVFFNLVTVFRLRNQYAGNECAQGQ